MKKVNLNCRGNTMPTGRKSVRSFYEEMIAIAKQNIGKTTEFGTVIDEKFISVLENRLNKLNVIY
jgi:hypothetical protein|tara:strand:+ start:295 stop:489 length:195 start_codon:yes stop_codon:yes gene_type:complete